MSAYQYAAPGLMAALQHIEKTTDSKINEAAKCLFEMNGNTELLIELEENELAVGEFETLLNGYQSLESISITEGESMLKVELFDDYLPIHFFGESFSTRDMLNILEVLENKIIELSEPK